MFAPSTEFEKKYYFKHLNQIQFWAQQLFESEINVDHFKQLPTLTKSIIFDLATYKLMNDQF